MERGLSERSSDGLVEPQPTAVQDRLVDVLGQRSVNFEALDDRRSHGRANATEQAPRTLVMGDHAYAMQNASIELRSVLSSLEFALKLQPGTKVIPRQSNISRSRLPTGS